MHRDNKLKLTNLVISKLEEISLHRIQYVKQAVWCINKTFFLKKLHRGSQQPYAILKDRQLPKYYLCICL